MSYYQHHIYIGNRPKRKGIIYFSPLTIAETIEQLCELTKRWTAHEDIPKSQQHECRTLGRELHKSGGESLMREAFYAARGRNPAASVIQCYWDNIGDWRW